jgi:hypothetical protein
MKPSGSIFSYTLTTGTSYSQRKITWTLVSERSAAAGGEPFRAFSPDEHPRLNETAKVAPLDTQVYFKGPFSFLP